MKEKKFFDIFRFLFIGIVIDVNFQPPNIFFQKVIFITDKEILSLISFKLEKEIYIG